MNLTELLHDAVDGIEPTDRIAEIRERTAAPARSAARPWFYTAGGVVLATAAAVTAFAVLADDPTTEGGPAHEGHAEETFLVPAYFVGELRGTAWLFREFDRAEGHDALDAALNRIQQQPADPDYRTTWQPGTLESAVVGDGTIDVELGDSGPPHPEGIVAQQLVYTLQGAVGERLPVQFLSDGEPVGEPYEALPQNDILSPVSISDPAEGASYEGSFIARGRANVYEGTVVWEIRRPDGEVVRSDFTTAAGSIDRLYPWEAEIDLTGLTPGEYTFVATSTDPSGGAEQSRLFVDTRTIVVR